MRRAWVAAVAAVAFAGAPVAVAWEAATTHAGLTEQAAFASRLHERLTRDFGLDQGLYQVLAVSPADAPDLIALLRAFSPTLGFSPDARGRQSALAWLVAGSAVADTPVRHFANHFFDPRTRRGLSGDGSRGALDRMRLRLSAFFSGADVPGGGMSAIEWIRHADNPMSLAGFWDQYDKAVSSATAGQRARHLAGALTAAGALLHVLEDMGSPSHVRDDLAAHTDPISSLPGDRASRFERIAALAYGRLGVPNPTAHEGGKKLTDLFTAADRTGLADRTAATYFSAHTLPAERAVDSDRRRMPAREAGLPASLGALDLIAAAAPGGAALRDGRGVCLLRYRVRDGRLSFAIDDACALEQVGAILPDVGAQASAMLDVLFRGSLAVELSGARVGIEAGPVGLGKGRLVLLWDDARGARTAYHEVDIAGGAAGAGLGQFPAPPAGAVRVVALFRGVDDTGERLRATGQTAAR